MNNDNSNLNNIEEDDNPATDPKRKKKRIVITILCIVCVVAVLLYLSVIYNPYNRFIKVEIGESLSEVQDKVGGRYESGMLRVGENGKEAYFYEFEDDILVAKTNNYYGNGLGSTVNYEKFCLANADMSLSELEEIFGDARLIRQNEDETCVYLWMENPSQYVVFNGESKELIASEMLNPVPNNTLITLDMINNLGVPNSLEELESKIGTVTLFSQKSISEDKYRYSCYVSIEDVEYDISFIPGDYVFVMTSLPLNEVDSELFSKLDEQMTYTDVKELFGSEGLLYSNSNEETGYSWSTDYPGEVIDVTFGPSGYYEDYGIGTVERGLSLFSPTQGQWKFSPYLYTTMSPTFPNV